MELQNHCGASYRKFIAEVAKKKKSRSYLEIGVRDGRTLALIECPSIGIDPYFNFKVDPIGNKTVLHLYRMTSDQFFRHHNPADILGGPIDLFFLDGLHQFEFLLRDFINCESFAGPKSLIMLDDCLPINIEMTERTHQPKQRTDERFATWWTGDVWKLVPILSKYRPDLKITCFDTTPTGNICISNLDNKSTILQDNYERIIKEFDIGRTDSIGEYSLSNFYNETKVISTDAVMKGFDYSIFIGD